MKGGQRSGQLENPKLANAAKPAYPKVRLRETSTGRGNLKRRQSPSFEWMVRSLISISRKGRHFHGSPFRDDSSPVTANSLTLCRRRQENVFAVRIWPCRCLLVFSLVHYSLWRV